MTEDFSGWATKASMKCSDGKTIMPNAFEHQNGAQVPLVWQHGHNDPKNVLGHVALEHQPEGVYARAFFNGTAEAEHARQLVEHGDIKHLSIWANKLVQRAGSVFHGTIREVSLVMAGANPGAVIENITIRHADGDDETIDDEAIIFTDNELVLSHADAAAGDGNQGSDGEGDESIQDVLATLTPKQEEVVHYMLGQALEAGKSGAAAGDAQHSATTSTDADGDTNQGETNTMGHNVFEKGTEGETPAAVLSHSDMEQIFADAARSGSLKSAVQDYALAHGIDNIDLLFPDAQSMNGAAPEFYTRRMEWVNGVLSACGKTPFSRVRTQHADLTYDEARAKGYIKGSLKKEQFFSVARRETGPKTIYKKQKLDRDDILDIADFDVVAWIKSEMRVMLDEELARAILIGDGREADDPDKIDEDKIRPIKNDDDLYAIKLNVNLLDASSSIQELTDAIIMERQFYKGTGTPTFYTSETIIARYMLLKDTLGRRIYSSLDQVASELRVAAIVPVEVFDTDTSLVGIIVNLADYNIGADKGGQVTLFDDFDIDYNQYKYLIETRVSGALKRYRSAIVISAVAGSSTLVTPAEPTWDAEEGEVTIVATTHVTYKRTDTGATVTAGSSPYAVDEGETLTIKAYADSGYYLTDSTQTEWSFYNPSN